MSLKSLAIVVPLVATLVFGAKTASATEPFVKVVTDAGQFLTLPSGVRNAAMGRVGAADDTDPINVVYNPANLGLFHGVAMHASQLDWPADVTLYDAGIFVGRRFQRQNDVTFHLATALSYSRLELAPVDTRVIFIPGGTGRSFESDWALPFTLSGGVSMGAVDMAFGATAKLVTLGAADKQSAAFDLGALTGWRLVSLQRFSLRLAGGASVTNLGNGIDFGTWQSDWPTMARGGFGLRFAFVEPEIAKSVSLFAMSVNADYVDADSRAGWIVGGEMGIFETAFFRIGHREDDLSQPGTSAGLGLQANIKRVKIRADYARLPKVLGEEVEAYGLVAMVDI